MEQNGEQRAYGRGASFTKDLISMADMLFPSTIALVGLATATSAYLKVGYAWKRQNRVIMI